MSATGASSQRAEYALAVEDEFHRPSGTERVVLAPSVRVAFLVGRSREVARLRCDRFACSLRIGSRCSATVWIAFWRRDEYDRSGQPACYLPSGVSMSRPADHMAAWSGSITAVA